MVLASHDHDDEQIRSAKAERHGMLIIVSNNRKVDSSKSIGQLIRRTRRDRRFSQIDLATAAGVGRGVVQKLEAGRGTVTLESALRILGALSLDVAIGDRLADRSPRSSAPADG